MINKKAQIGGVPILTLAMVILALLFLAPFIIKLVKTPMDQFSTAITNQSAEAGASVDSITGTFYNMWDMVIIFAFLINVIVLLITSFLIDVHPAFLMLYIIVCAFTMIFAPTMLESLNTIWTNPQFLVGDNNVIQYLPLTQFILNNFGILLLSIMVLSGIIMYSKFKFFRSETI